MVRRGKKNPATSEKAQIDLQMLKATFRYQKGHKTSHRILGSSHGETNFFLTQGSNLVLDRSQKNCLLWRVPCGNSSRVQQEEPVAGAYSRGPLQGSPIPYTLPCCWKRSSSVLSITVTTSHKWLLSTWNVAAWNQGTELLVLFSFT